jgi:UDP-N-acetylmuramyl pentapeptide phosphotransferase/UDP-N-acetylglucosamine-1-phosphate transferase
MLVASGVQEWLMGAGNLSEDILFSLYFMLPLVGVCIGFMYHNWLADFSFVQASCWC